MMRRAAAVALFAAIVAAGVQPVLLSFPLRDRQRAAVQFAGSLDRPTPGYREFLEDVRAHTRNGEVIAILVPSRRWEFGYSSLYYRAAYVLAGRQVLPLVWHHDELLPANFNAAQYIAAWQVQPPPGEAIVRANGGVLVKRR